jgi:hypothetical protein
LVEIELRVRPAAVARGTVRRADGRPVAGAVLTFRRTDGPGDLFADWAPPRTESASTDAAGAFASPPLDPDAGYLLDCVPDADRPYMRVLRELARVPATPIEVVCRHEEGAACAVTLSFRDAIGAVQKGRRATVAFWHGSARDPRDDPPARCSLRHEATVPEDGFVHLPVLNRGTAFYVVLASARQPPRPSEGFGPFRAEHETATLHLQSGPAGAIHVLVRDSAGRPVAGAAVDHTPWMGRPLALDVDCSDTRGEAWIRNVGRGCYEVTATASTGSGTARAVVEPGATTRVDVVLRAR